jgi:hypothetical protein
MSSSPSLSSSPSSPDSSDYVDLRAALRSRFEAIAVEGRPLFTTDTPQLWALFLDHLPADLRQHYTCSACKTFVERYGGLVVIEDDGSLVPAVWHGDSIAPGSTFRAAVEALESTVGQARIKGAFLSQAETYGTPVKGGYHHMTTSPRPAAVFKHPLLSAAQEAAAKRENRAMLSRALAEFDLDVVRNAHQLLAAGDHLYRGEKVLGVAAWLLALHESLREPKNAQRRENLIWRAAATAPPGFSNVRSSMIGTLLDDLASGLDFDSVKARFDSKMHPLQYQRPTAAPSAGQIAQAEAAIAGLKAAGALERRFAHFEDVEPGILWRPAAPAAVPPAKSGGVFDHLRTLARDKRSPAAVEAPEQVITWEKLHRTVLPDAETIEVQVPEGKGNYIALTTAAHPEAPPILHWDREDRRNPVSWYVYVGGSHPEDFNLKPGWVNVTAVCLLPPMWGLETPRPNWGQGVIFLLEGAKDLKGLEKKGGMGFFPEQLRSELHPFRKTLEAYAQDATLTGGEGNCAAGLDLRKGVTDGWSQVVRVTAKGGRSLYRLDRWD